MVVTPSTNIIKEIKLFGTVSTAFKAPTLENLFGYGANLNLTPEKSKNYEAGFNLSFADNKYSLRVAGFKRNLTNAIVYGVKVLDFYAEYTIVKRRVKFFVDLKNVLNEKYTEFYGYNSMGF